MKKYIIFILIILLHHAFLLGQLTTEQLTYIRGVII